MGASVAIQIEGTGRPAGWRFGPEALEPRTRIVVADANLETAIPKGQSMRLSLFLTRGTSWPVKKDEMIAQHTLSLKGQTSGPIGFYLVIPRDAELNGGLLHAFAELSSIDQNAAGNAGTPATGTVTLKGLTITSSAIKASASPDVKRCAYLDYAARAAYCRPDMRPAKPNFDIFKLPGLTASILEVRDPNDPRLAFFFRESSRLIQALAREGNRNGPFEFFLPIATYTVAKKNLGPVFTQAPGFAAYRQIVFAHQSSMPNYASGGARLFEPRGKSGGAEEVPHVGNGNFNLLDSAAGLLAAQEFPDLQTKETPKKAGPVQVRNRDEILRDMHVYLRALYHSLLTGNTEEYGSPIYLAIDFAPIRMVAEYAEDPAIRDMATKTLTWLYISSIASWNQGHYINSAGRSKGDFLGDTNDLSFLTWLLFDTTHSASGSGTTFNILMATPGAFRLPDAVKPLIDLPFVKRETSHRGGTVYVYTFQSKSFGLTNSIEDMNGVGRKTDPKWDSHGFYKEGSRNKLNWFTDKPGAFSPQWENSAQPYAGRRNQVNAPYYGINPWSTVLQCRGTQIGLSDVRKTYPFRKLYVTYPASLRLRVAKPDGWNLCHTGGVMFAFRSLRPPTAAGEQKDGSAITDAYDYKRTAWILEVTEAPQITGVKPAATLTAELDAFHKQLQSAKINVTNLDDTAPGAPVLTYTSPFSGRTLKLDAAVYPIPVDGEGMPISQYPVLATYPDNRAAPCIMHIGSKLQWLDGSGKPLYVIDATGWRQGPLR